MATPRKPPEELRKPGPKTKSPLGKQSMASVRLPPEAAAWAAREGDGVTGRGLRRLIDWATATDFRVPTPRPDTGKA